MDSINDILKKRIGFTYDELEKFDLYTQQRILEEYRENKYVNVVIGNGEHSIVVKMKKGKKYFHNGRFKIAGNSLYEARKKFLDRFDDVMYSKPISFVKKLLRK